MQAIVLVGGKGSRLGRVLGRVNKPMLPVAGKPFLEYLLGYLRRFGFDDIVLATGFRQQVIREHFSDGKSFDLCIRYSNENVPLGTAGALRNAMEIIEQSEILVVNGDTFFAIDLADLVRSHREHRAPATIALAHARSYDSYSIVQLGEKGAVAAFAPHMALPTIGGEHFINAGVYVLERRILSQIPRGKTVSLENEVFPTLVGHGLHGKAYQAYFIDIGTPERYEDLCQNLGSFTGALRNSPDATRIGNYPNFKLDSEATE